MQWRHNVTSTVMILGPAAFVFAFALDIYIPIIPQLHHVFHASQEQLQLTLSLFMFAMAFGQLFYGPISDQYGRLKPSIVAGIIFIIATVICATANSLLTLYLGRILQALGCCGLLVNAYAIVRDSFSGTDSARIYAYLNCFISISPLFAPLIGGYLDHAFGWRSVFWALLVLGALTMFCAVFLYHESHPHQKRTKLSMQVFSRMNGILANRTFRYYTLSASIAITVYFTFFSISPYIIITLLGVSPEHFGIYFSVLGATLILGSLICGKLVQRIGIDNTLLVGISLIFLGGASMALCNWLIGLTLGGFLFPFALAGTGAALSIGAGQGGAMEPFGEIAGTAAALFGAIEFFTCSIGGLMVMHWPIHSTQPLALFYVAIALIVLLYTFRYRKVMAIV